MTTTAPTTPVSGECEGSGGLADEALDAGESCPRCGDRDDPLDAIADVVQVEDLVIPVDLEIVVIRSQCVHQKMGRAVAQIRCRIPTTDLWQNSVQS